MIFDWRWNRRPQASLDRPIPASRRWTVDRRTTALIADLQETSIDSAEG